MNPFSALRSWSAGQRLPVAKAAAAKRGSWARRSAGYPLPAVDILPARRTRPALAPARNPSIYGWPVGVAGNASNGTVGRPAGTPDSPVIFCRGGRTGPSGRDPAMD